MESYKLTSFKSMIQRGEFVILDTETTGVDGKSEICQIAIVDGLGNVLIDTLIKPIGRIPSVATSIHGITNAMVANSPAWGDIVPQLVPMLDGRDVIAYNALFDRKMMHKSSEAAGLPKTDWKQFSRWWCAMEAFAEVYGKVDRYSGKYRWQKLATAAQYYNVTVTTAHTAVDDCITTLAVARAIAGLV